MTKNLNWLFLEIFLGGLSEFWKFALHSSKQNLETRGIRSYAGSFIFVMGKVRADLAAASALIIFCT